ncbi:hypothetical protein B484DRAFT_426852 [Ochromonadaceae sp. CCMP2298]|nr:hypothetical protein B484DRAFT_426852 [Ochromonadaceae sp. CCMP2298]
MKGKVEAKKAALAVFRAVDWKLFEVQSLLIAEDVSEEDVEESVRWLQTKHYDDVVEERTNDDRCGYPLCTHPLTRAATGPYRVAYNEKKVYGVEVSSLYCSAACVEKAQVLMSRFEATLPHSRPVARTLDLAASQENNFDDVLAMLGPGTSPTKDSGSASKAEDLHAPPPPAFESARVSLTGAVPLQLVDGVPQGSPAPAPTAQKTESSAEGDKQGRGSPVKGSGESGEYAYAWKGEGEEGEEGEEGGEAGEAGEEGGEGDDGEQEAISALHRFVLAPSGAPSPSKGGRGTRLLGAVARAGEDAEESGDATASQPALSGPRGGRGGARGGSGVLAEKPDAQSMSDMFAAMRDMRAKYGVGEGSPSSKKQTGPSSPASSTGNAPEPTGAGTAGSADNRFLNGSILQKAAVTEHQHAEVSDLAQAVGLTRPDSASSSTSSSTGNTARKGAGNSGSRPGAKNVSWGANEVSLISADAPVSATAALPAPAPITVVSQTGPSKPPTPVRRTNSMMSTTVMERVQPKYLSAAAIMRKREPERDEEAEREAEAEFYSRRGQGMGAGAVPTLRSSASAPLLPRADDYSRPEPQGQEGARLDAGIAGSTATGAQEGGAGLYAVLGGSPELAADAAAASMSIEGYIAEIKDSIRVAPSTTMASLSHQPFPPRQREAGTSSGGAEGERKAKGDGSGAAASVEGEDEEDEEAVGAYEEEEEEEEQGQWEDDDADVGFDPDEGKGASTAPARSLFITVWAVMDDLFGYSASAFDDRDTQAPAPAPSSGSGSGASDAGEDEGRSAFAMEQEQAVQSMLRLLQRGLTSAERLLDLNQRHLQLREEREQYNRTKHRLLAAATKLQRRVSASSKGDAAAATGLTGSGWSLIGLLIVDAIVVKKRLGPLAGAKEDASSDESKVDNGSGSGNREISSAGAGASTASASGGAGARQGVAEAVWAAQVEALAAGLLGGGRAVQKAQLREGDLQILRSFFDHVASL